MLKSNINDCISVVPSVSQTNINTKTSLKGIIEEIRSNKLKSKVDKIKSLSGIEKKRAKRDCLPAFYPSVELNNSTAFLEHSFVKPTGIVQFDLDDVSDVDALRSELLLIPEVNYLFSSPSGGLKFGVMTDFNCTNFEVVKKEYIHAYELVKKHIVDKVKINADDSVKSINQACWYSYDPKAYINKSPSILFVAKEAAKNRIKQDIEDEQERQDKLYQLEDENIDKDEAERALSYIPKRLPYHDRLRINLSVISIFGDDARPMLLGHWQHDSPASIHKQINDQISKYNSHRQGLITAGTLFHEARKNGYRSTKNNKRSTPTDQPPTFNNVSYTKSEAEKRLTEVVNNFFENRKSTLINYEAGAGKTKNAIQAVFDKIINNSNYKVAIFVQSHEVAEQYQRDFVEHFIKIYDQSSEFKKQLNLMSANLMARRKVQHIRGRNYENMCHHDLKSRAIKADSDFERKRLEKLYNENSGSLCLHCPYSVNCEYVNQFNNDLAQVRIYTHNQLFNLPSLWDSGSVDDGIFVKVKEDEEWSPDYIVVDEDVVSLALHEDKVEKISYGSAPDIIQTVIHELKTKPLVNIVRKHGDQIELAATKQLEALKDWRRRNYIDFTRPLDDIIDEYSGYSAPKVHRVLDVLSDMSIFIKKATDDNLNIDNLKHTGIWLSKKGDVLLYAEKASISESFKDKPIMLLDASADEVVVKAAFGERFEIETIRVNHQENVNVFQYENTLYSKRQLSDHVKARKRVKELIAEKSEGKKFGIITYQHLDSKRDFAKSLAEELGAEIYGYFGALRGLNKFENLDQLFIVGRHSIGFGLRTLCRQLFGGLVVDVDDFNFEPEHCVKNIFRLKDGGNMEIDSFGYPDSRMAALDRHFNKAETYQAVHRLRLVHGNKNKEVHILSNEVLDVSIDKLLRTDKVKVKTDSRVELIRRVIKEKGELEDKKSIIVDATGLSASDVSNLRRKDFKAMVLKDTGIVYEEREITRSNRAKKVGYFVFRDKA